MWKKKFTVGRGWGVAMVGGGGVREGRSGYSKHIFFSRLNPFSICCNNPAHYTSSLQGTHQNSITSQTDIQIGGKDIFPRMFNNKIDQNLVECTIVSTLLQNTMADDFTLCFAGKIVQTLESGNLLSNKKKHKHTISKI